jgi:hypothetical protein
MQHVMMDVAVEVEAATWLALRTAATFDAVDAVESANPDEATSEERAFSRLITAAAKYFITKQYPGVAYECMEVRRRGAGAVCCSSPRPKRPRRLAPPSETHVVVDQSKVLPEPVPILMHPFTPGPWR